LPRAAKRAEEAVAKSCRLPAAWALRGDVQKHSGNLPEALASYHRALSYQEHFPHVQLAVAEIYRESGRPQRALATLELLAEQSLPGQEPQEVLFQKGLALRALGRFEEAAESLAAAAKQGPPDAELLVQLSEVQLLAGDPTAASLTINQALTCEPRHAAALALRDQIESRRQQMAATLGP
jgi:tetratricopeptide (TPR) repeat protein